MRLLRGCLSSRCRCWPRGSKLIRHHPLGLGRQLATGGGKLTIHVGEVYPGAFGDEKHWLAVTGIKQKPGSYTIIEYRVLCAPLPRWLWWTGFKASDHAWIFARRLDDWERITNPSEIEVATRDVLKRGIYRW